MLKSKVKKERLERQQQKESLRIALNKSYGERTPEEVRLQTALENRQR